MQLWKNVRTNEELNIYPYANKANYVINSMLPYEVFVISKYFMDITENYSKSDFGYDTIISLRERLRNLLDSSITPDMVPQGSVFREFIL